jgi:hypothetical protein
MPADAAAAGPLSYRVFATRIGLVGEITANGHKIVANDHFVALPSRLGLSARGGGERTVRVCASATKRCEYAPVWDVGPWNTKDDYWNANRQSWPDLPRGLPQAQAAKEQGYNKGKDEFGRTVLNPAGIDLADGTFTAGLGLKDNAWVTVTYLWTGGGVRGRVETGGGTLRLRATPSSRAADIGIAARYAQVPILCQARGERIVGTVRTTDLWDRLAAGTYVSHAYVVEPSGFKVPTCT